MPPALEMCYTFLFFFFFFFFPSTIIKNKKKKNLLRLFSNGCGLTMRHLFLWLLTRLPKDNKHKTDYFIWISLSLCLVSAAHALTHSFLCVCVYVCNYYNHYYYCPKHNFRSTAFFQFFFFFFFQVVCVELYLQFWLFFFRGSGRISCSILEREKKGDRSRTIEGKKNITKKSEE